VETAAAFACGVLALVIYLAWEWTNRGLHSYNTGVFPLDDADEWRYTACSRLVNHGYHLFTQVFSAQPPLLFLSLAGGMRVFGDSIAGARVVEVGFGLVALGATAWITWMLAGPVGAGISVLVLSVSPLFLLYSRAVEAEGPMMAMVTLGLALALCANRRGGVWPCALAGFALAAAILFKLFALEALAPAVWIVLVRPAHTRSRFTSAGTLVACAIVPVVLEMALVAPTAQWSQVISLHNAAAGLHLPDAMSNIDILKDMVSVDLGLTVLALAGLVLLAVGRRYPEFVFLVVWVGGSGAMLLVFRPLFPHHAAILLTGLAVCAGVGAGAAWTMLRPGDWKSWLPVAVGALAYLILVPRVVRDDRHALLPWDKPSVVGVAKYVETHTSSSDFVAADDLAIADMSHRLVPPMLCDPSTVRLQAGYLSSTTLIGQTRTYRAKIVAPTRGTFLLVGQYISWLKGHYRPFTGPFGTSLYLRR
jgi:4-amino-4-deoxy-L-arabinose transferase-like glycosyltransferase